MRLLVTGGMGFIGSHFMRYWVNRYPLDIVVNLDLLTYAGNAANTVDLRGEPNYMEIAGDIADAKLVEQVIAEERIEAVVHFAAESHVDRSILDPQRFIRTNVVGTLTMLDAAKKRGVRKFVHVSTDEV